MPTGSPGPQQEKVVDAPLPHPAPNKESNQKPRQHPPNNTQQ